MNFESFCESFHTFRTRDPNRRQVLGLEDGLGELPDPSLTYADGAVAEAKQLLGHVSTLRQQTDDFDELLDLDLATLSLEAECHGLTHEFAGLRALKQTPRAGDALGDGLFMLFINDPRPAGARFADIIKRVEATPAYLDALLARTERPFSRWVKMDLEKVEGLPDLLQTIDDWASAEDASDLARFRTARRTAEAAITDYAARLQALPTGSDVHVGPQSMEEIIRLRGVDQSPAQLKTFAVEFLAKNRSLVEELRARLVKKYELPSDTDAATLQKHLAERYRVQIEPGRFDQVIERYEQECAKIVAFIQERRLFELPDDQSMKIMRTPTFMAPTIPAGAMLPPPPFRRGTRTSMVYLTLSEELMAEHTELSIPSMMVHEGIPGHHLQLSTAAGHESLIRRHAEFMDLSEGWTTMLEDYMLDVDYMGDLTDEARFSGQRDLARIGARVAIDLFLMSGDKSYLEVGVDCDLSSDDPFVAAGSLLESVTGFVPGRVQAELNWYSQERGYPLSYLTGNRLVWDLKRDIKSHDGGKTDALELDRRFHKAFLNAGNMPVSMLRRVFVEHGLVAG